MGMFTKGRYTLHDHSRDYALKQRAPEVIAECYAEHVVTETAAGAFGDLGANHATEWSAWSERNLSTCPECGSRWFLYIPCTSGRECQDCSYIEGK